MLSYLDRCSDKVASNTKGNWFNPKTNCVDLRILILSFCISLSQRASYSDFFILIWRKTFWLSEQRQIDLNWFRTKMSHRRFCRLGLVFKELLREEEYFVALADTSYATLTSVVSGSSR